MPAQGVMKVVGIVMIPNDNQASTSLLPFTPAWLKAP